MTNPLIIPILEYLKKQHSACSLIDLVNLCKDDLISLIGKEEDPQVILFQKNFFVMNALYQIQRDIQTEGFLLTIFPLEICLIAKNAANEHSLTTRDTDLAHYYLAWSNLKNITADDVNALFASFWQKYRAVDKVDAALATLGLEKGVNWLDIRQSYKSKVTMSHPDKGGCPEDFIEIRKAYEILSVSYRS
ncbi:DNA-J related domain-containing protein [Colwellia sp. 20A7]|uniref:DNA-J related domain-containing protein n=1 Tax=Colwellia sp. 20A7 TaxID=2689569 RepID=UPI00135B7D58|nr:DNA-J related domain-containing protein [Colwellia sp. 20A7]